MLLKRTIMISKCRCLKNWWIEVAILPMLLGQSVQVSDEMWKQIKYSVSEYIHYKGGRNTKHVIYKGNFLSAG